MLIRLPWKERKVISRVAKFYCEMALHGEGYDDRIRQFWRISMYVKVGFLVRDDAKTVLTAMESFHELYKDAPAHKDPNGVYHGMEPAIADLRALLERTEKNPKTTQVGAE